MNVRRAASLVRSDFADIPDLPLPDGFELRPIHPADRAMHRRVFDAAIVAFADHWGDAESDGSENSFQAFIGDPTLRPDLWRVAFHGDEIAGQILNFLEPAHDDGTIIGWTESITVQPQFRRRGLARALLAESLRTVRDAGATRAALGVDTGNARRALDLYESLGFRIVSESYEYQRPVDRTGRDRGSMSPTTTLTDWGWDDGHANAFASQAGAGHEAGRVLIEDRGSYLVGTAGRRRAGDRVGPVPVRRRAGRTGGLPGRRRLGDPPGDGRPGSSSGPGPAPPAHGRDPTRPDRPLGRRAGPGRQRRPAAHRDLAQPRPQPAPARALPGPRLELGGRARPGPQQGRPRRGRPRRAGRGRGAGRWRVRVRRERRHGAGPRRPRRRGWSTGGPSP